jgi:hypothetical protein
VLPNESERVITAIQEVFMLKFRLVFLGVASALVLGTGTALATAVSSTGSADADAHGDAAARVAASASEGAGDAHGDAVSKIASAEGQENRDGARAAAVAACKAADAKEKPEPKSSEGLTKAQKKADHVEDKKEHKAFVACIHAAK